ncbi:MAG: UvrD-helicase domain-containing protein, partial [Clostridia bacterium]|nr:UvrD-helicase domain-containing protein [Clostridia bacterium]
MPDIIGDFIKEYGLKLDDAQKRAAFADDGHVLLSAVPGSGKTTVMVARLGYLVRVRAVPASSILAVTYSVAAAKEMKDRYVSIFGDDGIEIRTIHGFCMT